MFFTTVIRKIVLEGHDAKLADAIRIGAADGMQDFTMSLKQLIDDQLDRSAHGVLGRPESRCAQDGAQRHQCFATRDALMVRNQTAFLAAALTLLLAPVALAPVARLSGRGCRACAVPALFRHL